MGFFVARPRKLLVDGPEAGGDLSEDVGGTSAHFLAVGEALASGSGSTAACEVAGRTLAQDGAALDEALTGLDGVARATTGRAASFEDTRALCVAWSEATLAYLHQLSCEDPLTGLASLAHVRSRLSELYRGRVLGNAGLQETHGLVVVDLPEDRPGQPASSAAREGADSFSRAMRLMRLGESARTVFPGGETIGRVGPHRIVVVVVRDAQLGRRVAILRTMLGMLDYPTRVWIEGLPGTDDAAALLLDELARP
jgi:hypothetical protein